MDSTNGRRTSGSRCIALVGPYLSGKTTLLEAILFRTGAIPRQGRVAEKSTVGDAAPEARAHGMSVELNAATTTFLGDSYTFIDCPGSIEFAQDSARRAAGLRCRHRRLRSRRQEGARPAAHSQAARRNRPPAHRLHQQGRQVRVEPRATFLRGCSRPARKPLILRQLPIMKGIDRDGLRRSRAGARLRLPGTCRKQGHRHACRHRRHREERALRHAGEACGPRRRS